MTPEECWKKYVGEESPAAFLERRPEDSPEAAVTAHVAAIPMLYGIVLCGTWRETFEQAAPPTRDAVCSLLLVHAREELDAQDGAA